MARLAKSRDALGHTLTAKQKEVAFCISRGMTQREAADNVNGVSHATVHNWLRKPEMQEYIAELHCATIDRAFGKALEKVEKALEDPNVWAQLSAADKIFALRRQIEEAKRGSQEVKIVLPVQTFLPDSADDDDPEAEDAVEVEGVVE